MRRGGERHQVPTESSLSSARDLHRPFRSCDAEQGFLSKGLKSLFQRATRSGILAPVVAPRATSRVSTSRKVLAGMDARLEAAQRGLIWLLVVAIGVLLLCLPRPGDARMALGFAELSEFERTVDLAVTERTRRAQAMQFAQLSLTELLQLAPETETGRTTKRERHARGPKWRVAEGAAPVLSLANLKLVTLAEVSLQSQGPALAEVG